MSSPCVAIVAVIFSFRFWSFLRRYCFTFVIVIELVLGIDLNRVFDPVSVPACVRICICVCVKLVCFHYHNVCACERIEMSKHVDALT